jgi:hypothetical protein
MSVSTKTSGSLLELEFAVACLERGGIISFPFGENAPYDVIVDNGNRLFRLQLKRAHYRPQGDRWMANTWRRRRGEREGTSVAVPYTAGVLDGIVTKVENAWYFLMDVPSLRTSTTICPQRESCPYRVAKNAWMLIGLPDKPV